jgi:hypothetical protein
MRIQLHGLKSKNKWSVFQLVDWTKFRLTIPADTFATIMSYVGTANKDGINSYAAIKSTLAGHSETVKFPEATE